MDDHPNPPLSPLVIEERDASMSETSSLSDGEWTDIDRFESDGAFGLSSDTDERDSIVGDHLSSVGEERWGGIAVEDTDVGGQLVDLTPAAPSPVRPITTTSEHVSAEPEIKSEEVEDDPRVTEALSGSLESTLDPFRIAATPTEGSAASSTTFSFSFPDPLETSQADIQEPLPPLRRKLDLSPPHDDSLERDRTLRSSDFGIPQSLLSNDEPSESCISLNIIIIGASWLNTDMATVQDFLIRQTATALSTTPFVLSDEDLNKPSRIYSAHPLEGEQQLKQILVTDRVNELKPDAPILAVVFMSPPAEDTSLPPLPPRARYLPILSSAPIQGDQPSELQHDNRLSVAEDIWSQLFITTQQLLFSHESRVHPVEAFQSDAKYQTLAVRALQELIIPNAAQEHSLKPKVTLQDLKTHRGWVASFAVSFMAVLLGTAVMTAVPTALPASVPTPSPLPSSFLWNILHPFTVINQSAIVPPSPEQSSQALVPASLKSLALAVFATTSTPSPAPGKVSRSMGTTRPGSATPISVSPSCSTAGGWLKRTVQSTPSISAPARPLTIDPPFGKTFTLPMFSSHPKPAASVSQPEETRSLSVSYITTSISEYFAPFAKHMMKDLKELLDALDELYELIRRLTVTTAQNTGNKLVDRLWRRNERAKRNARRLRDAGGRFVSAVGTHVAQRNRKAIANVRKITDLVIGKTTVEEEEQPSAWGSDGIMARVEGDTTTTEGAAEQKESQEKKRPLRERRRSRRLERRRRREERREERREARKREAEKKKKTGASGSLLDIWNAGMVAFVV